jgi:hypothetical protein
MTAAFRPTVIESAADWRGPELMKRTDWIHELSSQEIAEIEAAFRSVREKGIAIGEVDRENFALERFARIGEMARQALEDGPGVFLIRGFPAERYTAADLKLINWALGKYVGTAVSQSAEGDVMGDVRDLNADSPGAKSTRGYKSSRELWFHCDSADVSSLFAVKNAKAGGLSGVCSSLAVHNEMARTRPDLLAELYQPFYWTWQKGCYVEEGPYYQQPIFSVQDGKLSCRYIGEAIRQVHNKHPEVPPLTATQREAMTLFDKLLNGPDFPLWKPFQPGDWQMVNNHIVMHARTEFEDHAEHERRRHLLRMWLSVPNSRPLSPLMRPVYRDQRPGAVRGGLPPKVPGTVVFETTEVI